MSTIIVLHGWKHSLASWEEFRMQFPVDTVITFDLPGFGDEPLHLGWGVPEYAGWVKEKIAPYTSKGPVILLGHSFGGRIAAYIAIQQPPWLERLILYGAPLIYQPTIWVRFRAGIAKKIKAFIPFKKYILNVLFPESHKPEYYKIFKKIATFDLKNELQHITVPTLFVWGDNDTEAPLRLGRIAAKLIPQSLMVILPKSGHNIHIDSPYLFYGVVKKFIEGN
ncbi:MAG: alpha/beta hydrolase [Patescibacteria group bacterium]